MARKKVILIIGWGLLICILTTGFSLWACAELCLISHDGTETSDFRRFNSENDLQSYITQNLSLNHATVPAVRSFIEKEGIKGCINFPREGRINCRVFAPKLNNPYNGNWLSNQLYKIWFSFYYEIYFDFHDGVLYRVRVFRLELTPV